MKDAKFNMANSTVVIFIEKVLLIIHISWHLSFWLSELKGHSNEPHTNERMGIVSKNL